ncbi:hypothetical protein NliqN6_2773 [Naganishia liquefaciens]|uniref:Uncharacterized protein n=1 Tax=Naganishia liquefaciens TaxID=104408 RepID=A0A8H3TS08_9TREE|nr:hypothetical protein NliqN6_2773 [Naganishia liquefaciens]
MIRLNDDLHELQVKETHRPVRKGSYIVISGGTAANDFVQAFGKDCAFVLPVSDDGGSSSEILRCLGGPSIGDIRSRLIRLIPVPENGVMDLVNDPGSRLDGIQAVHDLFAQRFPATGTERQVKEMWGDIIEGTSDLWTGIPEDRREAMRAFFVHFNTLILRRAHKHFSFKNCSLGNVFLAAARDMLGGLPGAIFMFKALSDSHGTAQVMPVIVTNQRITIAAKLENGRIITGQCEISHPAPESLSSNRTSRTTSYTNLRKRSDSMSFDTEHTSLDSDTNSESLSDSSETTTTNEHGSLTHVDKCAIPGSPWRDPVRLEDLPKVDADILGQSLRHITRKRIRADPPRAQREEAGNALYVKGSQEVPLESRIEKLYYIENAYGHEIFPDPNGEMIKQLHTKETLVYSCGSLWTSIIPCLALRGVASTIARSKTLRHKVLLLNFKNDRETDGYTAIDYINAISSSLNRYNKPKAGRPGQYPIHRLLTHVVFLEGGKVPVDTGALKALGIAVIMVPAQAGTKFTKETVEWALSQLD